MANNGRNQKFHGQRHLLNGPGFETTAAIVAEIEDSSTWDAESLKDRWAVPRTTLQFSDCTRSVSYTMDICGRPGEYENNLEKVDKMIKALQAFKRGIKIERERHIKRCQAQGRAADESDY